MIDWGAFRFSLDGQAFFKQFLRYHIGFRGRVSRNNLAHANEHRNWRIFADFGQVLIAIARDLYQQEPLA